MKEWTRLPDWIIIVLGIATAISPTFAPTGQISAAVLLVLGALIAAAGFLNLVAARITIVFWVAPVLGALLFISPWLFVYTDFAEASWWSWIVGLIVIAVGVGAALREKKERGGASATAEV